MLQANLKDIKPTTYNSIGSMHKYWGKKPYNIISEIIKSYTQTGDTVMDPFMGSGVTITQALTLKRNAIGVDLNPISVLLARVSVERCDSDLLLKVGEDLIEKTYKQIGDIYSYKCNCKKTATLISAVRLNNNEITRLKLKCIECGTFEREVTDDDISETKTQDNLPIIFWYPDDEIIPNSRINAKVGMRVSDLFTRRNLNVCAALLHNINEVSDIKIKEALLISFTANLPNASRLTPIIKQRGPMDSGAWMTGFYVGKDYLEQNVLWYFKNRLTKTVKAKKEIQRLEINSKNVKLLNENSAQLNSLESESVDFVFTDPPYGDAVPYFEQSILYNSWLKYKVNYSDEIVISDSKTRNKNIEYYTEGLSKAFHQVHRVLKKDKFMILTFHSMDGEVWHQLAKSILESGFELVDIIPLYQKTSTPRQLNRENSIKCDMLLAFKKNQQLKLKIISILEIESIVLKNLPSKRCFSTDEAFQIILTNVYKKGLPETALNITSILRNSYRYTEKGWMALELGSQKARQKSASV